MGMEVQELLMALTRQQLQLTEQIHALTQAISLMSQTNQVLIDVLVPEPDQDDDDELPGVALYMDGSRQ